MRTRKRSVVEEEMDLSVKQASVQHEGPLTGGTGGSVRMEVGTTVVSDSHVATSGVSTQTRQTCDRPFTHSSTFLIVSLF